MSERENLLEVVGAVQEGDLDSLREAVQQRIVSVNSTDPDGCSLLHWAAINNRVQIANFLIENGADPSFRAGGVLGESPFQWALRKRLYYMMHVLRERGFADLSFKSVQGNDSLMLACKLGDMKAVFLLLYWGADPNTPDKSGDTPLLWLLRNRGGTPTSDTIRLLLRFGADATYQNPNDGYSALHLLCCKKKVDKSLAIAVYKASGYSMTSATDSNGWTPHTLAVNNENRFVVRFLFESILNELLPQWLPAASAFAMVLAVYWALDYFSPLYGLVASWALYAGTTFALFQWQLIDLRGRAIMGMFTGFIALLFGAYYAVLAPRLHSLVNLYQLVLALLMVYLVYKIYTIRPLGTKCENRSVLAAQIVYLAPSEGTDEETAELCRQQGRDRDSIGRLGVSRLCHLHADTASANSAAAGSAAAASAAAAVPLRKKGGTRFVRDKFTGQVRRVDVEELDPMDELEGQALLGGGNSSGGGGSSSSSSSAGLIRNSSGGHGGGEDDCDEAMRLLQSPGLRCRTLGPNICGHCVADRRYIVKPHMHPDVLKLLRRVGAMEDEPNWLLQKLGFQFAQEHAHNPDEILSIATHCLQCGACVLDQDHHSSLLGNCIGKGNRRLYLLFLVITMAFLAVFFASAKYVQQFYLCSDNEEVSSKQGLYGIVSREWCAFEHQTALYALSFFDGCFLLYFAFHLQLQVLGITRETTLSNTVKLRYYPAVAPTVKRQLLNFFSFIYSGMYNVHYVRLGKANLIVQAAMAEHGIGAESDAVQSKEQRDQLKAQALLASIDERISAQPSSSASSSGAAAAAAVAAAAAAPASRHSGTSESSGLAPLRRNSRAMSVEPVEDFAYERSTAEDLRPVYGDVDYDSEQDFDHFFVETSINDYFEYFYGDKQLSNLHRHASSLVDDGEAAEDEEDEEDDVQIMLMQQREGGGGSSAAAKSARRAEELEHRMLRGSMNRV